MHYVFRNRGFGLAALRSITSNFSTTVSGIGKEISTPTAEKKLTEILKKRFSNADKIHVADVSGGCGAMFDVTVISSDFKGMSIVKQHRMVTEALKEEIKQMHGLRISTSHEPISS